jgi:hypothetical protein
MEFDDLLCFKASQKRPGSNGQIPQKLTIV